MNSPHHASSDGSGASVSGTPKARATSARTPSPTNVETTFDRQRGPPGPHQRVIARRDDVEPRVDQRPVEIERDRARRLHRSARAAWRVARSICACMRGVTVVACAPRIALHTWSPRPGCSSSPAVCPHACCSCRSASVALRPARQGPLPRLVDERGVVRRVREQVERQRGAGDDLAGVGDAEDVREDLVQRAHVDVLLRHVPALDPGRHEEHRRAVVLDVVAAVGGIVLGHDDQRRLPERRVRHRVEEDARGLVVDRDHRLGRRRSGPTPDVWSLSKSA